MKHPLKIGKKIWTFIGVEKKQSKKIQNRNDEVKKLRVNAGIRTRT